MAKREIVCLSTINWDFLFQRHHHLMLGLAQSGHPVYFCNASQVPDYPPQTVAKNIHVYRDFSLIPPSVWDRAIFFIYDPAFISLFDPSPNRFVIYDCVDDFPHFDDNESLALSRVNLVLCTSEALMTKHRGRHPELIYLPNGVDVDHFQSRPPGHLPPDIRMVRSKSPVIGFSGAMYPQWVDIDLLYFLARERPDWSVALVGESYGWDFSGAPANLSHLGRKSYKSLPFYLQRFDVALIPFLENQISRGTNPIKLYEYLATGLPVVSRALPFAENLGPPLLYRYQTPEECLAAIEKALKDEKVGENQFQQLRLEYAVRNSWKNRLDKLMAVLNRLTWLEWADPVSKPTWAEGNSLIVGGQNESNSRIRVQVSSGVKIARPT
ncbi:MAG: glycosyltransferase [Chitinophagales bacterium]